LPTLPGLAVAYLQKAIVLRADYRELARMTHAFDKIRQDEIFRDLLEEHETEGVNGKNGIG